MAENKEKLFDMFPPVSTEEWMAKINADLKGADFSKKLVWRTNEGFNVMPFYRKEDIEGLYTIGSLPGEFPFVRGTRDNNDWLIRQQILGETPQEINDHARHSIDRGVESIGIKLCKDFKASDLETILKDIDICKIEVNISCCPGKAAEVAEALVAYVKAHGAAECFRGAVEFNPFKRLLRHGLPFPKSISEEAVKVYNTVKEIKGIKCFMVDSFMLNNAEIVKAYNPESDECCKINVHAVTSQFNQTIYDAHVNLLRSMTETMSAALAGVDSIETLPFDMQYKQPDEFSERIARNQQLLLRSESHLDKVVDPAGGSYYIETLTASIAEQAWKLFLETQEAGGFEALLTKGEIQGKVNESGIKRHTDVARRKEILLGTNQYPNFNEKALDKIEKCGCSCGCGEEKPADGAVAALNFDRAASQFEQLRLDTERSAKRPKVFMLTIGNLAMRLARAQFSANFFGCAGYEIIDNIGFNTVKDGVDAAMEKGADIVVLCSSDDEYAQFAPEAYKELNGRALFVVAGAPACMDDLKAQGIEDFIHVRVNVLETLIGLTLNCLSKETQT